MSTVKANSVEGLTKPLPDNLLPVTASAWASFNGVATSIDDSFNISSITDISTGFYQLNFEAPLDNSVYSVTASTNNGSGTGAMAGFQTRNTSDVSIITRTVDTASATDQSQVTVQVFGGQS